MMTWKTEYSLRNNAYLKKRFLKGLLIAGCLVYGAMLVIILLGFNRIQSTGFMASGYGIMLVAVSGFFWLITLILWISESTTYLATYQMSDKHIKVRIKATKQRKALLGLLDFINYSTYTNQPGNVSIHSLGSQGSFKITWRNATRVRVLKKYRTILVKGKPGESMPAYYDQTQAQAIYDYLIKVYPKTEFLP